MDTTNKNFTPLGTVSAQKRQDNSVQGLEKTYPGICHPHWISFSVDRSNLIHGKMYNIKCRGFYLDTCGPNFFPLF